MLRKERVFIPTKHFVAAWSEGVTACSKPIVLVVDVAAWRFSSAGVVVTMSWALTFRSLQACLPLINHFHTPVVARPSTPTYLVCPVIIVVVVIVQTCPIAPSIWRVIWCCHATIPCIMARHRISHQPSVSCRDTHKSCCMKDACAAD